MLVKILGFGSNWWARFGRDPLDRYRFTKHAAYFNSTGVRCGNKMKRYWIVPGLIRFNGIGDFNPHFPNRSLGETFECADIGFACGGNRLLFRQIEFCEVDLQHLVEKFDELVRPRADVMHAVPPRMIAFEQLMKLLAHHRTARARGRRCRGRTPRRPAVRGATTARRCTPGPARAALAASLLEHVRVARRSRSDAARDG